MQKPLFLILFVLFSFTAFFAKAQKNTETKNYSIIIDGFDWGPAVSKVILPLDESPENYKANDFEIFVTRSSTDGQIPPTQSYGKRNIILSYPSDAKGNRLEEGNHLTLVLSVAPNMPLGSPIQYMRVGNRGGNFWIDYQLQIIHQPSGTIWNNESERIRPIVDEFDLEGQFTHQSTTLSYASWIPEQVEGKIPLIIWLHGGGEGGTDPTIALMGNKAFNYASPEIQALFGGAAVLVPQAPTFWMQASEGMTRGQTNDIYNEALFALIDDFVKNNPSIDASRIYVGGCSNGGYMSLKLILEHPDYFAAGYISALAYHNEFVSDQQIKEIKNVPIWFVHSKDDQTTKPDETVVPLYKRLKDAGAKNVVFSYYDNVTDITGFFGGEDFRYNGHWSWIYSHANTARTDFDGSQVMMDGKPVTIMEWLAGQKN
ncbi:prolyl oligopeptidase family serine peptidase [Algoriphagus formosus]|uniref:prolyl oligopeptidase family serine peptidase n=1 Tax=Algoriphagus formosus TaxID=2007308 RepID=UPI000C282DE6|nr:prolyl oligopeptidase family serine peptidase [Algoriphagus formosus]